MDSGYLLGFWTATLVPLAVSAVCLSLGLAPTMLLVGWVGGSVLAQAWIILRG
jgi:hypothetical protein